MKVIVILEYDVGDDIENFVPNLALESESGLRPNRMHVVTEGLAAKILSLLMGGRIGSSS